VYSVEGGPTSLAELWDHKDLRTVDELVLLPPCVRLVEVGELPADEYLQPDLSPSTMDMQ
jgi:hypothetical protein